MRYYNYQQKQQQKRCYSVLTRFRVENIHISPWIVFVCEYFWKVLKMHCVPVLEYKSQHIQNDTHSTTKKKQVDYSVSPSERRQILNIY